MKKIKFGDIEIGKQKSHQHKESISIKHIEINKMAISNKVQFGKKGFKYFNSYKDAKNVRPLCICLLEKTAYRKDFDETKFMSFFDKKMMNYQESITNFGKKLKII